MTAIGYASTNGDPRKVNRAGDTMTGELALPDSSPDTALAAASKGYVDGVAAGKASTATQIIAGTGLNGGGTLAADRTLSVAFGTTASTACVGNDSRLSNSRTPTAHATSHAAGGSDPVTPASLGLVDTTPADAGLITWSYPPWAASSAGPGNSGTIYYMRVRVPAAATVTGARLYQTAPGATLTSGQCLVGLYDSAGNRVAISSDQSAAWASGSQVNRDAAFTSQYSATAGYYWVAMLFVGSTGPSWSKGPPSGLMNAGWPAAPFPALVSAGGQTALPASVALSSLSTTVSAFWASLY